MSLKKFAPAFPTSELTLTLNVARRYLVEEARVMSMLPVVHFLTLSIPFHPIRCDDSDCFGIVDWFWCKSLTTTTRTQRESTTNKHCQETNTNQHPNHFVRPNELFICPQVHIQEFFQSWEWQPQQQRWRLRLCRLCIAASI